MKTSLAISNSTRIRLNYLKGVYDFSSLDEVIIRLLDDLKKPTPADIERLK